MDKKEAVELFHRLWGNCKISGEYNKERWKRLQQYIEEGQDCEVPKPKKFVIYVSTDDTITITNENIGSDVSRSLLETSQVVFVCENLQLVKDRTSSLSSLFAIPKEKS